MTIFTDSTFLPIECNTKLECLRYVEQRCANIKHSLRFVEIDTEHLTVRCPVSGDYLDIVGTPEELNWLHVELVKRRWYRTT